MPDWWCYRCGVACALAVCSTCGSYAPYRLADKQKGSNPDALRSPLLRNKLPVGNIRLVMTRATNVVSFVSQFKSKVFRPSRSSAYMPHWWCYRCGSMLASFVCPTCGLRGPDYGEPTLPVDDLERAVQTDTNVKAAFTSAAKVGYLTKNEGFPQGEVSEVVIDCLVCLVRHPLVHWFGYHDCDLYPCGLKQPRPELRYKGIRIPSRCSTDILVPDEATAYVAPALILHYILFHQYLPPTCFIEAVLACPDPSSAEYLDTIERIYPAGHAGRI